MTSGQMGQKLHGGQHLPTGFLAGIGVLVLIALMLAWVFTRPLATPTVQSVEQPVLGRSMIVTGLRYDGTTYRNAPIAVSASIQPLIGRSMVVTGLIYDGTTYRNVPIALNPQPQPVIGRNMVVTGLTYDGGSYRTTDIHVAAPTLPRSYTVSALVYDEQLGYHTAPVRVGGR